MKQFFAALLALAMLTAGARADTVKVMAAFTMKNTLESPPAAVTLVTRGEAPVALVFSTDAKGVAGIKVAGVFPSDSHPPIVFLAAILRDSHAADA
jgi:ABC-type molybdate transport system substrate-binding protein